MTFSLVIYLKVIYSDNTHEDRTLLTNSTTRVGFVLMLSWNWRRSFYPPAPLAKCPSCQWPAVRFGPRHLPICCACWTSFRWLVCRYFWEASNRHCGPLWCLCIRFPTSLSSHHARTLWCSFASRPLSGCSLSGCRDMDDGHK